MKIEHFALNVAEPVAMAAWYVDNLGFKVARHMDEPPFAHFLEDSSGTGMLEIYNNPPDEVPVYAEHKGRRGSSRATSVAGARERGGAREWPVEQAE